MQLQMAVIYIELLKNNIDRVVGWSYAFFNKTFSTTLFSYSGSGRVKAPSTVLNFDV